MYLTTDSDSEGDQVFADGPHRNGHDGYDMYEKYPNAVHHRRSLPNIGSEPPKVINVINKLDLPVLKRVVQPQRVGYSF